MTYLVEATLSFLVRSLPEWSTIFELYPIVLGYVFFCASVVGLLRVKYEVDVAYTRKIHHFLIIGLAGPISLWLGPPGIMIFGTTVSVAVLVACWYGDDFAYYEAMARPSDRPSRKFFVLIPLGATALGGVSASIVFPGFASIGYWVCGFGDAVGEPVGKRYGNHWYEVPSTAGVSARRSLEGSLAVFFASALAAFLSFVLRGYAPLTSFSYSIFCAGVATILEAVTTHGFDNFTIQFFVPAVMKLLLQ